MKYMHTLTILLLTAAGLLLSSCGESRDQKWKAVNAEESQPAAVSAEAEGDAAQLKRHVLIARVAAGPLAEEDPELSVRFARDLTDYIRSMVDFAEARYSNTLPLSDDAQWEAGPVAAMSGAHVAVLTTVDKLEAKRSPAPPYKEFTAQVTMRAYDVHGQQFWSKTAVGTYADKPSPKLSGPASQPRTRAAWEATRKCIRSLGKYLQDGSNDTRKDSTHMPEMGELPMVRVLIDSTPANADVIVDGTFRGTTPCSIDLPVTELQLQVRRQGYQPWSTSFKPTVDMPIKPALEKLP